MDGIIHLFFFNSINRLGTSYAQRWKLMASESWQVYDFTTAFNYESESILVGMKNPEKV